MAPDFDKIQAGMTNGLNKTSKVQKEEKVGKEAQLNNNVSFRQVDLKDMGTGVAGRSSVKMDNLDTDMISFRGNYKFADATNKLIDELVEKKGYSLEQAISAVYGELGVK